VPRSSRQLIDAFVTFAASNPVPGYVWPGKKVHSCWGDGYAGAQTEFSMAGGEPRTMERQTGLRDDTMVSALGEVTSCSTDSNGEWRLAVE